MNEQENNTMYQIDFKKPMAIHFIGIGGISMSGLAEVLLWRRLQNYLRLWRKRKPSYQNSGRKRRKNLLRTAGLQYFRYRSGCCVHCCNPPGQSGIQKSSGDESSHAHKSPASGTDHAQLWHPCCSSGNSRQNNHYLHAFPHSAERWLRSYHQRRRHSSGYRRKYPCRTVRDLPDRACEYTNSFLSFFPKISIILNIDADHLDFFKDIEDIRCSFRNLQSFFLRTELSSSTQIHRSTKKSQKDCPARYLPTVWSMRQIIQLLILPITSLAMPPLLYAIKDRLLAPAP